MKQFRKLAFTCAVCIASAGMFAAMPPDIAAVNVYASDCENVWDAEKVISYDVYADRAVVVGCDSKFKGDAVILSEIKGVPVTRIDEDAFFYCEMTSLSIPDSVTAVNEESFANCNDLKTITVGSGIPLYELEDLPFSSPALETIAVSPDNPDCTAIDGVLYNKKQTKLIRYPAARTGAFA